MTIAERQDLARHYMAVAAQYSDRPILRDTVSIWLDALDDLEPAKIHAALRRWLNDPKANRAPTPGQIREIINPSIDERTEALEAASRVIAAVSRFGCQGTSQVRDARAHVGELGWKAVERLGGWVYICENLGTKHLPLTTAQAQIRDLCEAHSKLARAGRAELPPGIPKLELEESKSVMKMIEAKQNPKEGK